MSIPPFRSHLLALFYHPTSQNRKKGINYGEWDVPASTVMCQDIKINVPTVCKENVILVAVKYQFILSQKHFETFQSSSCLLLMSTFLLRSYSQFTWWLYLQNFSKDRVFWDTALAFCILSFAKKAAKHSTSNLFASWTKNSSHSFKQC